jgi:predicted type IV restriction endonuclease
MGTPPDAVRRLIDARDMTEMSDISDRVPSPADRKVFLSGDYKEEQLRAEFLNPFFTALGWDMDYKQEEKPEVRKAGGVRVRA